MNKEHPLLVGIFALAGIYAAMFGAVWLAETIGISRGISIFIALVVYFTLFSLISWSLTIWRQHRQAVNEVRNNAYMVYREEKHVTDVQPVSRVVKKTPGVEKENARNVNE